MTRWPTMIAAVFRAPVERYIHAAMLVVLAVAFATSFESGSAGAGQLGYPDRFEAALPLVCDIVAGVATVIHGRVRDDKAMLRTATWFVLVPMLLSWGANAVDHVKHAPADTVLPDWGQTLWVIGVVLAAGICPVAVAALLHLSTKYAEYERRQAEQRAYKEGAEESEPVVEALPAPDVDKVDERGLSLLWNDAPAATPKPAPAPARVPAPSRPAATRSRSTFLENPPAKAIELAQQHGKDVLRRKVLEECGIEISEHQAKKLRERHGNNGHKLVRSA